MEELKNKVVISNKKAVVYERDLVGSFSSFSSSSESGISSGSSLESDSFEEVTSPVSTSASSSADQLAADPLNDMSSLVQQLPIKRGLSNYYQGKSESFTSLANVSSLEDLAKAENPYNKRLKCYGSYEGRLGESHRMRKGNSPNAISRDVVSRRELHSEAGSRGSCANFTGGRPPIPARRSTNSSTIPNQTALFV